MTGTSLYKKVSTRGGSTMMKHKQDAWGFKHGSEHHRDENKPHEEGGDPYAKKGKTVMKHARDDWGFEHGKKYHRSVIGGGPNDGKPAPGHESETPNKHTGVHGKFGHQPSDHEKITPRPLKGGKVRGAKKGKSVMKHAKDEWGFEHGKKYHRSVTGEGKTAPGHTSNDPEMRPSKTRG